MVLPVFKVKGANDSVRELIKEAGHSAVEGLRGGRAFAGDDSGSEGSEGRASGTHLPSMNGAHYEADARGSEFHMDRVVDALVKGVVKPKLLCGVDQNHHISKWLRKHGRPEKHEMNELQLAQLKEVFELMDIDNSGAIDVSELRSCFKMLGMKVSFADAKEMLKSMDTDGSGQIEYDEFLTLMTRAWASSGTSENSMANDFQFAAAKYRRTRLMNSIIHNHVEETHAMVQKCAGYKEKELQMKRAALQNAANRYDLQVKRKQQRASHQYGEYERRVELRLLPPHMRSIDVDKLPMLQRASLKPQPQRSIGPPDPKPLYKDKTYRHLMDGPRLSSDNWSAEEEVGEQEARLDSPEGVELVHATNARIPGSFRNPPAEASPRVVPPPVVIAENPELPQSSMANGKKKGGVVMIPPAPKRREGIGNPRTGAPSKALPSAPRGAKQSKVSYPHRGQPIRRSKEGSAVGSDEGSSAGEQAPEHAAGVLLQEPGPLAGGPRVRHWPMHHVSPLAQHLRERELKESVPKEAAQNTTAPEVHQDSTSKAAVQTAAKILLDAPLPDPPAHRQPAGQPKAPSPGVKASDRNLSPRGGCDQQMQKKGSVRPSDHIQASFPSNVSSTRPPAVPLPLFASLPPGGVLHRLAPQYGSHSGDCCHSSPAGHAVVDAGQEEAAVVPPTGGAPQGSVTSIEADTPKSPLRAQKSVTGFGVALRGTLSADDPETLGDVLSRGKISSRSPRAAP